MNHTKIIDTFSLFASILAILIPTIIFILSSPENITPIAIIIFSAIGIFLLIALFSFYFYSRWKNLCDEIDKNKKENQEIKKSLNLNKLFNDMDIRLKVLEKLIINKKAQIDPRILLWVIIAILLYLFLKTMGLAP
jgi:hypothetical protein